MAMQNISLVERVYLLERESCTFLNRFGVSLMRSLAAPWYFHRDNTSEIAREAINVGTVARCATATIRKYKYVSHGVALSRLA